MKQPVNAKALFVGAGANGDSLSPSVTRPLKPHQLIEQESALPVQNITPTDLKARLDAGEEMLVIDVRTPQELEIASVDFTRHIVLNELPDYLDDLPTDKPIVLMCHAGGRSMQAAQFLANQGWEDVYNLQGGIVAWSHDVDPSIPTY